MPARAATEHSDDPSAALREHGYRVTPQRLEVQRAVEELGRHVTAEEILAAVSARLPSVSLPTVYSALEALEEAGLVRRIAAGRGPALYDARVPDHHHLVCRRCGRVEDLDAEVTLDEVARLAAGRRFAAERTEVVVHGLCVGCQAER